MKLILKLLVCILSILTLAAIVYKTLILGDFEIRTADSTANEAVEN